MSSFQIFAHQGAVVFRRNGGHLDDRASEPADETHRVPDIQARHFSYREFLAGVAQRKQSLLDQGSLAALRRLINRDVLPLGNEIPQEDAIRFPADEILAGDKL